MINKKTGKIVEYNGNRGTIITEEGKKYLLLKHNSLYEDIEVGDIVAFNEEIYQTIEIKEYLATFIKKIKD